MSVHNHAEIPSLDGIRAVSIGIVFLAHAGVSTMLPGGFGVTIFFFLSGYLITTLFVREVEKTGRIDLKSFYLRRFLRLSPPLFTTLVVVYGLVAMGLLEGVIRLDVIASQVLYYYNYFSIHHPNSVEGALGLNVLWSLSVEEHFYLIFPFLFLLYARERIRLLHFIVFLILILVWRVFRINVLGSTEYEVYASTDSRFDSLLYGSLLALLVSSGAAGYIFKSDFQSRHLYLSAAFGILLFTFVFRDDLFRSTLRYSLQGIALMPIFYYSVHYPDMAIFRPLNWRLMRMIGLYSYTIYLVHTVVLGNLPNLGISEESVFLFPFLAFLICVGYAAVVFRFIEAPVKSIRSRLTAARFKEI